MNCIRCENEAGYNRVVVDTVSGREVGRVCRNCELDEFGRALERHDTSRRMCAMCDRDGHVALAPWIPTLNANGEYLVSTVDYQVTDRTPFLCDEHFHDVAESEREGTEALGRSHR